MTMAAPTKLSEVTVDFICEYLRIPEPIPADEEQLTVMMAAANQYIQHYTGRTADELDGYSDVIVALLVLVQDMYDNRALYVDTNNVNKTVESILDSYSVNLLPSYEESDDE